MGTTLEAKSHASDEKSIAVQDWMAHQKRRKERARDFVLGFLACLKRELSITLLSPAGVATAFIRLALWCSMALSPIWIRLTFDEALAKQHPWGSTITASIAILVLIITDKAFAHSRAVRVEKSSKFNLASEFGGFIATLWPDYASIPADTNGRETRIRALLQLVLSEAKLYLREGSNSSVAANLWVFTDATAKMGLMSSTSHRRVSLVLKAPHMIANYVAKSGVEYVVHDYKRLKDEKIASHRAKFRSIYFIPLVLTKPVVDKESQCVGVLTIICDEPYRFWPSRKYDDLRIALSAHIALLTGLLANRHGENSVPVDDDP